MPHRPLPPSAAVAGERLIVVAGLLLFFALALGTSIDKSATIDEPAHITRGIVLSRTGELSLQVGHTPLAHRLIGLLMPTVPDLADPRALAAWPTRDRLLIADELLGAGVDVERVLFLARLPIILSGMLLGATLALWTRAITRGPHPQNRGATAAATAVVMSLFASSSNLLASAALATTDMVATATYFAAVCAWWFYWQRPGRLRLVITGVLLGLALGAKLTGVLAAPLLLPLAYIYGWERRQWWRPTLVWLGVLVIAAGSLWVVYAFQLRPVPLAAYWQSWRDVLNHVSAGHQAFFLGEVSGSGWWSYFPVSLLLKTPLPVLLLYGAALIRLLQARAWQIGMFLLLPVIAVLAAAVYSRLNIGYRHILPAIPFVLLAIGWAIPALGARRAGRRLVAVCVAWAVVAALWIHPHHLAYFNELIGGPARGYRYLGDSNLDWGQDLRGLAEHAAGFDGDLYISYGGAADPADYGLTQPSPAGTDGAGAPRFHPANPAPGRYALSAGHVQGLLPEADLYDWFRRREPDDSIGYSILLYDVAAAQPGGWIAQCAAPAPLLTPEEAERLVGASDARHLAFDCAASWVFPDNGAPGWYILPPGETAAWIDERLGADLAPTLVYQHRANTFGPAYEVRYWPGTANPGGLPAEPAALAGGPAELRGYAVAGSEWITLWQVAEATTAPLSVQAHLDADDGSTPVADGLGFSADQWQPGDWFIQRHVFATPGSTLRTGLYNYVTLETVSGPLRLESP